MHLQTKAKKSLFVYEQYTSETEYSCIRLSQQWISPCSLDHCFRTELEEVPNRIEILLLHAVLAFLILNKEVTNSCNSFRRNIIKLSFLYVVQCKWKSSQYTLFKRSARSGRFLELLSILFDQSFSLKDYFGTAYRFVIWVGEYFLGFVIKPVIREIYL